MATEKLIFIQIVTFLHFALTAIALFRLFKLQNVTGGFVILSLLGLCVPLLGPFVLILAVNKRAKLEAQSKNKASLAPKSIKATKK